MHVILSFPWKDLGIVAFNTLVFWSFRSVFKSPKRDAERVENDGKIFDEIDD